VLINIVGAKIVGRAEPVVVAVELVILVVLGPTSPTSAGSPTRG